MPLLQLIILALVQGITEFIPVSSSAHLILVPLAISGWDDQGPLIDIAVHVGSLGAVVLYFRKETADLVLGGIDLLAGRPSANRRLFMFIAAATIPILVAAAIIVSLDILDTLRNPLFLGLASIVFGLFLWRADRQPAILHTQEQFSWKQVMIIGGAQALALIPGASRSGVTITAARFLGVSRPEAARFSMLLAIPTIGALGTFAGIDLLQSGNNDAWSDVGLVVFLSFLSALAAIHIFMKMTKTMSFTPFVLYRLAFGLALIVIALV